LKKSLSRSKSALVGIEALAFASFSNGKKKEKSKVILYSLLNFYTYLFLIK